MYFFKKQIFLQSLTTKVDKTLRVSYLSPTSRDLGKRMLQLAFTMGLPANKVLAYLMDKTPLQNVGTQTTSSQGSIFYATFRSTINVNLVAMASALVPELMRYSEKESSIVADVLIGMLDQVGRSKTLRKK